MIPISKPHLRAEQKNIFGEIFLQLFYGNEEQRIKTRNDGMLWMCIACVCEICASHFKI